MQSTPSSLVTIVRAGAGAGKTTSLVHQVQNYFHHFKKQHERAPRLVVTTFTKKATQELRERLLSKATKEKDWAFVEYLQSSDLFVTTIHGVLHQFLKKVGHLTDQDPSFQIINDEDTGRLSRRILQKIVNEELISSAWLARYGFKRSQELANEFVETRAYRWPVLQFEQYVLALQQRKDQFLTSIESELSNLNLDSENFVQYQQSLLQALRVWPVDYSTWKNYADSLPSKPRSSKTTTADSEKLEKAQELLKDFKKFLEEEALTEEELRAVISELEEFDQWARIFYERFSAEKRESSLMSMHDLEALSVEILNERPELGSYFANEWDYWLIDEFQDTSPVQMEILEKLTHGKPIYLVGDPQQSIYLFRGAKAEIFHKEWEGEGRQRVELNKNYRSRPALIHLAADVFESPMVPAREAPTDEGALNAHAIRIVVCEGPSENEEALATAKGIIEKHDAGSVWSKIAVLGRTHQELSTLSLELRQRSIPFVLVGGKNFWQRQEISDIVQFLKFLINPHDNLNLLSLLRSSWMTDSDNGRLIPHEILVTWIHEAKDFSYWQSFQKKTHPVVESLKDYLERAQSENLISLAEEYAAEKGLLDAVIALDITGQKECQIWKLLTWLRQQERLPGWQILKSLQQMDESLLGDPGSAREVDAVQLMTIHASKGLEFDHVFVLGAGRAPSVTLHKPFSADEDDGFWSFTVRNDERNEFMATRFCRLHRENLRLKERAESKRLFYVAATRAKETLTLMLCGGVKKESWLSMMGLPEVLEDGVMDRSGYAVKIEKFDSSKEHGVFVDDLAVAKENVKAKVKVKAAAKEITQVQIKDLWQDQASSFDKKAISVTKLIENPSYVFDLKSVFSEKKKRGIQIHKLFEILKYHSWEGAEKWIQAQALSNAANKNEFKASLDYIRTLADIPFEKILSLGNAEWGFQVQMEGQWIEGQVDLWAEVDGVLWIVDYKTGSQIHADSAWKQLALYGQALRQLGYVSPQKHVVLYPLESVCLVRDFIID